ncbi:MAG: hypothetical protein QUV05_05130 [Phycisphaerae bacterium]|nr:hypothetical protein [Phycisphaerae bacterium]
MTEHPAQITDALPEHWPTAPAAEPVRPWWLPWPIAVLAAPLLWILPKRMGPHFAAVRWPGIIAAHLLWTLYGVACICLGVTAPQYSWIAWFGRESADIPAYAQMTFSQTARAPVAQVVWELCREASFGGGWGTPGFPEIGSVVDLLLWVAVVAGTEISLVIPALLLMPYIAAGERTRQLLIRSIKITLLSTTVVFPVSLVLQCAVIWINPSFDDGVSFTLVTALGCVWFCWVWIRAGMRYPGPAEGPGWEPRKALCENCGYSLTGQQVSGRCPECGRPVSYSLPSSRHPTPMAAARDRVAAVTAFLLTYLAVLVKGDFFKRIAVHAEFEASRRFAIWSSIVFVPLAILITVLCIRPTAEWEEITVNLPLGSSRELLESICMSAATWAFTTIGLLLILGGTVLACTWFGWKPIRPRAVVVFFWSVWLTPLYAAVCAATVIVMVMSRSDALARCVDLGRFGNIEWFILLAPVPFIILLVPTLLLSARRLLQGSRQTRFANA